MMIICGSTAGKDGPSLAKKSSEILASREMDMDIPRFGTFLKIKNRAMT